MAQTQAGATDARYPGADFEHVVNARRRQILRLGADNRKPDEARGVIADCDVALNPCVLNEWTEVAVPVKMFDYLAEGRPVVSTPMAELHIFGDLIETAAAGDFIPAIERALVMDGPEAVARRREASKRFTLQDRARRAFELVTQPSVEVTNQRLA